MNSLKVKEIGYLNFYCTIFFFFIVYVASTTKVISDGIYRLFTSRI